jgi:hypothetical protein
VFISLRSRIRQLFLLGCVSGAALMIIAVGQASAATYPGGGSTFTGSAEGWTAKAECPPIPLALLCSATGSYDGTAGNPAGSFADKTVITLDVLGIFHSEVTETSPTFTVGESGAGTLRLERQFENAELLSLAPSVEYTANLVDKTNGTKQKAIADTVEGASTFAPKQGSVSLVAGHSYAIEIEALTKSTALSVGLLGSATFRVDNVSLTGPDGTGGNPPGGNGGNGNNGGNGGDGSSGSSAITSSQLQSLMESQGLTGPATLTGSRISVKANCPAKVGTTCKVTVQGLIKKGKPATNSRSAKIKQGKTKKLALKVKPAQKSTVKAKKRLLFKMTVKAGTAKATVYKSLKLIKK